MEFFHQLKLRNHFIIIGHIGVVVILTKDAATNIVMDQLGFRYMHYLFSLRIYLVFCFDFDLIY